MLHLPTINLLMSTVNVGSPMPVPWVPNGSHNFRNPLEIQGASWAPDSLMESPSAMEIPWFFLKLKQQRFICPFFDEQLKKYEEMLPMLEKIYLAIAHLCSNDG